jgi:hypothetical protein
MTCHQNPGPADDNDSLHPDVIKLRQLACHLDVMLLSAEQPEEVALLRNHSNCGERVLSLPLWSTGLMYHFLDHFTDGRTPWTGDRLAARPLPKHRTTQTQKISRTHQTSMP